MKIYPVMFIYQMLEIDHNIALAYRFVFLLSRELTERF